MKEYVIYDSVKKGTEWKDVVVTSKKSFRHAKQRFLETIRKHGYLETTGCLGCFKVKDHVFAWYEYHSSIDKWVETRRPRWWDRWKTLLET
jgi:hypothetical protein